MLRLETYLDDPCSSACYAGPLVTVACQREGEHVLLHVHVDQHPRFGKGAQPLEVRIQKDRVDWAALLKSSLALVATPEDIAKLLVQVQVELSLRWSWLPPIPQPKLVDRGGQAAYA